MGLVSGSEGSGLELLSTSQTIRQIDQSELGELYRTGLSINEIAQTIGKSYTMVRNHLSVDGTSFRTKKEASIAYRGRHPDWASQFTKYHVNSKGQLTDAKALLLTSVITEGYLNKTSIGFTNTQDQLHRVFTTLVKNTYGRVRIGTNGINSRLSSVEIAEDLGSFLVGESFSDAALDYVMKDTNLCREVLRHVADTEGSMIISLRKAPRNFTVECRVVLATTSTRFAEQLSLMLTKLGISSRRCTDCVNIGAKKDILRFVDLVGFSRGVMVVRKRAGSSTWYGKQKFVLSGLCKRIYEEQRNSRSHGLRGSFADCATREQTLSRLNGWYDEVSEVVN